MRQRPRSGGSSGGQAGGRRQPIPPSPPGWLPRVLDGVYRRWVGREAYDLMQAALSELHQKGPEDGRTVLVAPFLRGRPGSYDLHRAFRVSPEEVVNLDPD